MLEPKRVKRRRVFRGAIKGNTSRGAEIAFGDFAIKAMDRIEGRLEPREAILHGDRRQARPAQRAGPRLARYLGL